MNKKLSGAILCAITGVVLPTSWPVFVPEDVPPCHRCQPTQGMLSAASSWVKVVYSEVTPQKGSCIKNDQLECTTPVGKCVFSGYIYLIEIDTGAGVTPLPPERWELTSQPGAQKRWKAVLGESGSGTAVACGDEPNEDLSVTYTQQGAGQITETLKLECEKCPDQQ